MAEKRVNFLTGVLFPFHQQDKAEDGEDGCGKRDLERLFEIFSE